MLPDHSTRPDVGPRKREHQSTTTELIETPFISTLAGHDKRKGSTLLSNLPTPPQPSAPTLPKGHNTQTQSDTNPIASYHSRLSPSPSVIPASRQKGVALNVYARSYVPSGLRAINDEPTEDICITKTKHKIEFERYIQHFAGLDFLTHHNPAWIDDGASSTTKLNEQSYIPYFALLLRRELEAREKQNQQYALYGATMQSKIYDHTQVWMLPVPGLREDSPLVEMGDTLHIRQLWADSNKNPIQMPILPAGNQGGSYTYRTWTGRQLIASVYSVSRYDEVVYLRVDGLEPLAAYNYRGALLMMVNVVFPIKERIVRGQRSALLSVGGRLQSNSTTLEHDWIRRMLFPTERDGKLQTKLRRIPHRELFDHAINYEQAHAVNSVCVNDYGALPYLISGPPGTGKTKTLVETAMQLLNTTEVAHVLICAPSEAAADTLALRLKRYLTPKQLLRLNAPNRADNEVPRELLQYCFMQEDMFYLPPFKMLMSFSVVVTTCRDAAILAEARLANTDLWTLERDLIKTLHPENESSTPILHWGALLVDEAAQATEIDVLPAISVVCPPSDYPQDHRQPLLVMAGDEHQLGPRTASQDVLVSRSLFARLFSQTSYASHPLSRSTVKPSSGPPVLKRSMLPILYPPFANLVRNYRSHPAILTVPSSLFYNDTLIPEAVFPSTPLQASSLWRGSKWPVLYIPHTGPDEIERENGGWYNNSEARLACSIAETLVLECSVQQKDVCIMSPFAAQVRLLRSMIRSSQYGGGSGMWDVNIGPVEAFQGLEKRAAIVCTTRTRQRFVDEDVKKSMGLIHQKRKMNVALTRAKEALFVIGSPEVMGADEHWRAWMAFCERNGLIEDQHKVWTDREKYHDGKTGVLERALIAKADGFGQKQWPALGAAAANYGIGDEEYAAWIESLREALGDDEDDGKIYVE